MARNATPRIRFSIFYILLAVWLLVFFRDIAQFSDRVQTIPYSQFLSYLHDKKISKVEVGTEEIHGAFTEVAKGHAQKFVTVNVKDPNLVQELTAGGVQFQGVHESTFWRDLLSWVVPAVILAGVWIFMLNRFGQASRGGPMAMGRSKAKIYAEKGLKTRFEDVAGVDEAKAELTEIVTFLRDPKSYSKLGGRMPKGILLIGPPGTGKTLLARAVAGEAGVPFFSINGSEFVELFVGLGAARVRDLFEQGRAQAPCIIFIDELDALGKARGLAAITGASNDEKEQTLNQLLAELDGFDPSRGIIVLAATNRPEVLDPALLRAGRFDRQVLVDKPDRSGRVKILEVHLRKIKRAVDVNTETLASLTAGFSGADLANLANEAALIATRRGAEAVEPRDFTEAIERIVAGLERKSRLLNPEDKRRVAFHEMGHTTVALAMGKGEEVHKVSIIPRGLAALGYTMRRPTEDRYLLSREELEAKLAIAMGGRASESVFFNDITTGAADDLDKATEIARAMVTRYGMSQSLGLAIFEREQSPILGGQMPIRSHDYSEKTAEAIDSDVERILDQALKAAVNVVNRYRAFIEEGTRVLLDRETLDEGMLKVLWTKHGREAPAPPNLRRIL